MCSKSRLSTSRRFGVGPLDTGDRFCDGCGESLPSSPPASDSESEPVRASHDPEPSAWASRSNEADETPSAEEEPAAPGAIDTYGGDFISVGETAQVTTQSLGDPAGEGIPALDGGRHVPPPRDESTDGSTDSDAEAGLDSAGVAVGEDPDEVVDDQSSSAASGRRRLWVRTSAVAALYSAALIGFGVVIGWTAVGRTSPAPPTTEVVEVPIVSAQSSEVTMPDLRGIAEQNARTALIDAGIMADRVTVDSRPAAGAAGIVIEQDPSYGSPDPATATLTVSTPAAVPALAGQPEAEATAELLALGARVEVQRQYDPDVGPGDVIGTRPKAGKPIDDAITLTVAEAPGSVYLTQLDPVDDSDSCYATEAILSGRAYDNALECDADTETREYVWLLGDKADQFVAVIGVADDGEQSARSTVRVLVDGKPKASGTVSYTKPLPVDIGVTGGTQLQVRLTNPDRSDDDSGFFSSSKDVPVIIGDGRLIGSSTKITKLAGWGQQ